MVKFFSIAFWFLFLSLERSIFLRFYLITKFVVTSHSDIWFREMITISIIQMIC
jgi:hypothetical protein